MEAPAVAEPQQLDLPPLPPPQPHLGPAEGLQQEQEPQQPPPSGQHNIERMAEAEVSDYEADDGSGGSGNGQHSEILELPDGLPGQATLIGPKYK